MARRAGIAATVLLAAAWAPLAAAQPPMLPATRLTSPDLPGQPLHINVTAQDAQWCAFACLADARCAGYSYAPPGCAAALPCPDGAIGCCWLKSAASSADTVDAPACAGSFIMRATNVPPPSPQPSPAPPTARNVLYLLVDDLRPELNTTAYGQGIMVTPALARLAAAGTTFVQAYCNIAVCSPSRMSFLTGRYPHHTLTWNFVNHFRQATCVEAPDTAFGGRRTTTYATRTVRNGGAAQCCSWCAADGAACAGWSFVVGNGSCLLHGAVGEQVATPGWIAGSGGGSNATRSWVSLPQHFTASGYLTQSSGKIFHTEEGGDGPAPWDGPGTGMPPLQDPVSWSQVNAGNGSMANVNAIAPMRNCDSFSGRQGGGDSCSVNATADGDVPEGTKPFCDRVIRDDAVVKLRAAAANRVSSGQPFLLAVGFRKPHLPFRHPSPYDAMYPSLTDIPLAHYPVLDASVPPIAFHETSLAVDPYTPLPEADASALRRDYYAATSWTDANVGAVLDALEASGVANETLIIFHADHGWSLGEHGEWEKFTCWEHGTRVPLIVVAPWLAGSAGAVVSDIVELVDVFPTMAELAGVPAPASYGLDGTSLAPLMRGRSSGSSGSNGSDWALSVYPRCPAHLNNASQWWRDNDCMTVERSGFPFMGLSLRTQQWRYTEWLRWNTSTLAPMLSDADGTVGVELYDHSGDTGDTFDGAWEVVNLAGNASYAAVVASLAAQLRQVYPAGSAWPPLAESWE